jgi:hypothetical protein
MNNRIRASLATATVAATLLTPSIAHAGGGGGDVTEGACFGAVTYKLKAADANASQVAVEFEVDANRVGQQWRVSMFHNGTRVVLRNVTTAGLSGSFTVNRLVRDANGDDRFRARAVRMRDGRTCGGSLVF